MKLLYLYRWIAGSMTDFINQFKDNATLYQQARAWWGQLESQSFFILLIMIVLGVLWAIFYYKPYNETPGRHYHPKHWMIILGIDFICVFVVTFLFEYIAVAPNVQGSLGVEFRIAIGNSIYATALYLITSFVWCNWLPTNAYRLLKI